MMTFIRLEKVTEYSLTVFQTSSIILMLNFWMHDFYIQFSTLLFYVTALETPDTPKLFVRLQREEFDYGRYYQGDSSSPFDHR